MSEIIKKYIINIYTTDKDTDDEYEIGISDKSDKIIFYREKTTTTYMVDDIILYLKLIIILLFLFSFIDFY
jgi:hypothetical protein